MQDLSLHILDIAQNSIRAGASLIEIEIIEDEEKNFLVVRIKDNGKGMVPEVKQHAADPFFSTKQGKKFGLGLALLYQATREAEGSFEISSVPGAGTEITATFKYSHPDCKPIGDMAGTLETLVLGNKDIDFVYKHRQGKKVTLFDTRKVKGAYE
jgi:signal transduction histidine kinase